MVSNPQERHKNPVSSVTVDLPLLPVIAIIAVLYFALRKPVKKLFEKKRAKKTAGSEKTDEVTEKK